MGILSKYRFGISQRITFGILILVAMVLLLSTISFYSLKRFQSDVVQLSSTALPALTDAAHLNTELGSVVLNAVELARVESHPKRQLVIRESREGLIRASQVAKKLQKSHPDQILEPMLQVLAKSIEDLNDLKSSQIDAETNIHKAENDLSRYMILIADDVRALDIGELSEADRRALADWQTEIILSSMLGQQVTRLDGMRQVRRLQIDLNKDNPDLLANHVKDHLQILSFQKHAEDGLDRFLFGDNGLFPSARSALQLRLRTQGIAQQTRVLVNEMVKSMAALSESINSEATLNTGELIELADTQLRFLLFAALTAFAIAAAVYFYFERKITRRMLALNSAVIAHTRGTDIQIPTEGSDEIADMGRSVSFFIGEIDRRQQQILTSERQFRDIVDGSVQAILIVADGEPLFWNQALITMFALNDGYKPADFSLVVSTLPAAVLQVPASAGVLTFNRIPITLAGLDEKWVDLAATNIVWDGQSASQIIIADVTHNILTEKTLHIAKNKAEEAGAAKTHFLATMSHEIRSPMNGIISMSQLLQESNMDPEHHNMTSIINQSARALLSIINDILDFAKIDAGKLEIETTRFNLQEMIEGVLELMAPKIQGRGIEFILDITAGLPEMLEGDSNRLRQILLNLVGNAEKFTGKGSITLRVLASAHATTNNINIQFDVEDTGIGIDNEVLPSLFTPFKQAEASTARRYGGSGLGLSICKRLTDLMGGTITASSSPGLGSTFSLTLPFGTDVNSVAAQTVNLADSVIVIRTHPTLRATLERSIVSAGGRAILAKRTDDLASLTPNRAIILLDAELVLSDEIAQKRLATILKTSKSRAIVMLPYGVKFNADLFRFPVFSHLYKPAFSSVLLQQLDAARKGQLSKTVPRTGKSYDFQIPSRDTAKSHGSLILVAEDNPVNQIVIRKVLSHLGFAFDMTADGIEALGKFKTGSYGMVLTDLHMPDMDGFALAEAIRALPDQKSRVVPIIAVTADVLQQTKEKCLAIGMNGFLQKPLEVSVLEATVCHWLPAADQLRRSTEIPADTGRLSAVETAPTKQPTVPQTASASEIFDESRIGFIFEDNWEEGMSLVDRFIETLTEKAAAAAVCLNHMEIKGARECAHAAKGAAGSVGALLLFDRFKKIESLILGGDTADATKLLADIDIMIKQFEQTIRETYPETKNA